MNSQPSHSLPFHHLYSLGSLPEKKFGDSIIGKDLETYPQTALHNFFSDVAEKPVASSREVQELVHTRLVIYEAMRRLQEAVFESNGDPAEMIAHQFLFLEGALKREFENFKFLVDLFFKDSITVEGYNQAFVEFLHAAYSKLESSVSEVEAGLKKSMGGAYQDFIADITHYKEHLGNTFENIKTQCTVSKNGIVNTVRIDDVETVVYGMNLVERHGALYVFPLDPKNTSEPIAINMYVSNGKMYLHYYNRVEEFNQQHLFELVNDAWNMKHLQVKNEKDDSYISLPRNPYLPTKKEIAEEKDTKKFLYVEESQSLYISGYKLVLEQPEAGIPRFELMISQTSSASNEKAEKYSLLLRGSQKLEDVILLSSFDKEKPAKTTFDELLGDLENPTEPSLLTLKILSERKDIVTASKK